MLRATTSFAVCAALAAGGVPPASTPLAPPHAASDSLRSAAGSAATPSTQRTLAGKPSSKKPRPPKPPKSGRGKPPGG